MNTPNTIIVEFIKGQPASIIDSFCIGFACLSKVQDPMTSTEVLHQSAYGVIDPSGHTLIKASAAAAAVGLLDYHFSQPRMSADDIHHFAETKDSDMLRDVARQTVLKNAMVERAAKEWAELRRGPLSYDAIRTYESSGFRA